MLFIVSTDSEERASLVSYNFDYLGLILELFDCFKPRKQFYTVELSGKGGNGASGKKVKFDPRNDDFFREFAAEDLPSAGENIYHRVSEWQQKFNEMGFNQGKSIWGFGV